MKKPVILGVLAVVLVVLIGRAFLMKPPAPPAAPPTEGTADAAGQAPSAGPAQAAATPAPNSPGKAAPVDVNKLLESVQQVDFAYDPGLLSRNPMTPLVGRSAVFAASAQGGMSSSEPSQAEAELLAQRLSVTGIVYDKRSPVAVVNNDVVAPGDVLQEGAVVQAIEPDHVVLKVGASTVSIPLKRLEE